MTNQEIKTGTLILDTRFNTTFVITSVTEKRINCDDNVKYTTSTGRTSSKFYFGHKHLNEYLKNGNYKIQ